MNCLLFRTACSSLAPLEIRVIGRWAAICKHGRAVFSHTDALSGASLNSNPGVGALGYRWHLLWRASPQNWSEDGCCQHATWGHCNMSYDAKRFVRRVEKLSVVALSVCKESPCEGCLCQGPCSSLAACAAHQSKESQQFLSNYKWQITNYLLCLFSMRDKQRKASTLKYSQPWPDNNKQQYVRLIIILIIIINDKIMKITLGWNSNEWSWNIHFAATLIHYPSCSWQIHHKNPFQTAAAKMMLSY